MRVTTSSSSDEYKPLITEQTTGTNRKVIVDERPTRTTRHTHFVSRGGRKDKDTELFYYPVVPNATRGISNPALAGGGRGGVARGRRLRRRRNRRRRSSSSGSSGHAFLCIPTEHDRPDRLRYCCCEALTLALTTVHVAAPRGRARRSASRTPHLRADTARRSPRGATVPDPGVGGCGARRAVRLRARGWTRGDVRSRRIPGEIRRGFRTPAVSTLRRQESRRSTPHRLVRGGHSM